MNLKISSEKINNPFLVDLLEKLADSFRKMDHDFFIIGATARDIIIQQMLNTSSRRKTRDLDLAIAVPNWQEFDKILISATDKELSSEERRNAWKTLQMVDGLENVSYLKSLEDK